MERNYELVFKRDSLPGHSWNPNAHETDKKQHWKKGDVFSKFTWDKELNGEFVPEFDIFEVREVY